MMITHQPALGRNIVASLFGALMFFLATAILLPSQVNVHAGQEWSFDQIRQNIEARFTQLNGDTNGSLCADNAGLRQVRTAIDQYDDSRPRKYRQNYHLTTRLIACMVSPIAGDGAPNRPGYVIDYGRQMVTAVSQKFMGILAALAVLAAVLWGIRIVLGYARELQSTSIMIIIKVGMLMWALSYMGTLYDASINTMNQMAGVVAKAIPTHMCPEVDANAGAFNSAGGDRTFLLPWVKLDCAVESIATMVLDSHNSPVGTMVTAFLSEGIAKGLSASFFAALFSIFSVMNLALFIIVLANLALVLMFLIAPLCWVCIMFKPTMKYFHKWLTLTIGFLMQPILLSLFLMMMISAYEQVVCIQNFSVVAAFNKLKGHPNDYGPSWCTREKVAEAISKDMIDPEFFKALESNVVPGNPDMAGGPGDLNASVDPNNPNAQTRGQLFSGFAKNLWNTIKSNALEKIVGLEGFNIGHIDVPQINKLYVNKLSEPFQSLLSAFVVLFVLYAFLKQLPNFINQLASSAVTSGNLNQMNMDSAAHKGLRGMDQMTKGLTSGSGSFGITGLRTTAANLKMPGSGSGGSQ
jgi:type IV secretory pathway VirB6-like protein